MYLFIYLIYLWLCWVFVSVQGLSLVAASGGHSSSRCAGLSLSRPLSLRSTGCRRTGSVIVAHGPSCSAACGIFPDQGSNPCPLHWQADSQPLRHQGSPVCAFHSALNPLYNNTVNTKEHWKQFRVLLDLFYLRCRILKYNKMTLLILLSVTISTLIKDCNPGDIESFHIINVKLTKRFKKQYPFFFPPE